MAERKISELTAITAGELADDDNLLLVDTSAAETKKLAKGELISSIQAEVTFSLDSIDPSGIFTSTGILDDDGNVVTATFPDDDETIATTAALDDRYASIASVPTATSELTNDSDFITTSGATSKAIAFSFVFG